MNIPTLIKPHYKDGGNYYTKKDKNIIKKICNKKNETSNTSR